MFLYASLHTHSLSTYPAATTGSCHVQWVSSSSSLLSVPCCYSCCWLYVHICVRVNVCVCVFVSRFKSGQMSYQEQTSIHCGHRQILSNLPPSPFPFSHTQTCAHISCLSSSSLFHVFWLASKQQTPHWISLIHWWAQICPHPTDINKNCMSSVSSWFITLITKWSDRGMEWPAGRTVLPTKQIAPWRMENSVINTDSSEFSAQSSQW